MSTPVRRFRGTGRLAVAQPDDAAEPTTLSPWVVDVSGGRIVRVAERATSGADDEIDLGEALVTPGLVDAHTHPVFAGDRSDEAAARLAGEPYTGGGILRTVAATRATGDAELSTLVEARLRSALRRGTTTLEAKSGYGLTTAEELRALRILGSAARTVGLRVVRTFLGAHAVPPEAPDASAHARVVCDEMLPAVADDADACDVFCDEGFFDLATSEQILSAARRHGLQLRLHAEQLARTGAAELGVRLGAASVDHLEQLDEAGVTLLARSSTVATLLPGPALAMRSRLPPARALLDAGGSVALASDANAGTFGSLSMPLVIGLGATLLEMRVAEALRAATAGGAASLGLADTCGTVRAGLAADLVAWDTEHEGAFAQRMGDVDALRVFVGGEETGSTR